MQGRRNGMSKIRKVLQLSEWEYSQSEISRTLKISRPSISEIIKISKQQKLITEKVKALSDSELEKIIYPKKNKAKKTDTLTSQFQKFKKELSNVGVTKQVLWEEYISKNPEGVRYSQFCNLFKLRNRETELWMHIEYKAGDKLLVDYAGKKLSITDRKTGKCDEVETFVGILCCSGLVYVEMCKTQ